MRLEEMVLVSVDDHVCEPADMWDQHLPAKWKPRAPRLVHREDDSDVWLFEGRQIPNIGLNAVAGRPPDEYGMEPTAISQLRAGCYDVDARVDDMNANGMLGSLCFPSVPGFVGELFGRHDDKDLARAMIQAYNDWHVDEWCAAHPGRFIPLAIPMMWDAKLMADEVRRMARKGCHAMTFPDSPRNLGRPSLHDPSWEPFWKACDEEGTIVCIHIGSGTALALEDDRAPVEVMMAATPISLFSCATDLVFSEFLRKYPNLKIALSEGGTGWVPYLLERLDYTHAHHRAWTKLDLGGKKPSDIFREHIVTCFIDDAIGIEVREHIGLHNITWECDYPHSDTTWPRAPEALWRSLEGLSDHEIDRITHLNAMEHFRYDPFSVLPREDCTVAALRARATHVDVSLRSGGGGKSPSDYASGHCTIGDIKRQMINALSTPFRE